MPGLTYQPLRRPTGGSRRSPGREWIEAPCPPSLRGESVLDDQRIDNREALAGRMHEDRVEIDLGTRVRVAGGKARQRHDQAGERVAVRGGVAAHLLQPCRARELADPVQR